MLSLIPLTVGFATQPNGAIPKMDEFDFCPMEKVKDTVESIETRALEGPSCVAAVASAVAACGGAAAATSAVAAESAATAGAGLMMMPATIKWGYAGCYAAIASTGTGCAGAAMTAAEQAKQDKAEADMRAMEKLLYTEQQRNRIHGLNAKIAFMCAHSTPEEFAAMVECGDFYPDESGWDITDSNHRSLRGRPVAHPPPPPPVKGALIPKGAVHLHDDLRQVLFKAFEILHLWCTTDIKQDASHNTIKCTDNHDGGWDTFVVPHKALPPPPPSLDREPPLSEECYQVLAQPPGWTHLCTYVGQNQADCEACPACEYMFTWFGDLPHQSWGCGLKPSPPPWVLAHRANNARPPVS